MTRLLVRLPHRNADKSKKTYNWRVENTGSNRCHSLGATRLAKDIKSNNEKKKSTNLSNNDLGEGKPSKKIFLTMI